MEFNTEINFTSYPVKYFRTLENQNRLNVNQSYQRNIVWEKQKKENLIQSIFMKCPIQSIIISQNDKGIYNILDGKQRITTILSFLNNEFDIIYNNLSCKFSDLDYKVQSNFENAHIQTSINISLSYNEEAIIFERINRATILSDGEKLGSYINSPLTLERNTFFNTENKYYRRLCSYFGQFPITNIARKNDIHEKTCTILLLSELLSEKKTPNFDYYQNYLEMSEIEWSEKRLVFLHNLEKYIRLWDIIVVLNKIEIPTKWKKPNKLWKRSFMMDFIFHSMHADSDNYIKHWVLFFSSLSKNTSLLKEWPHTSTTIERGSGNATCGTLVANGYYQVKFYNTHGKFDMPEQKTQSKIQTEEEQEQQEEEEEEEGVY
jgi:hypothetical protein